MADHFFHLHAAVLDERKGSRTIGRAAGIGGGDGHVPAPEGLATRGPKTGTELFFISRLTGLPADRLAGFPHASILINVREAIAADGRSRTSITALINVFWSARERLCKSPPSK